MKLSIILTALATTQIAAMTSFRREHVQSEQPVDVRAIMDARATSLDGRKLDGEEFIHWFLVSHIDEDDAWCITAAEGTKEFGNLKLKPCDFDNAPLNQLWFPSFDVEDFKIHSALDDTKCITVNHGTKIFDGARARLSDCDNGLTAYIGDGHIHVTADPSYCLTNRGPRPHPTDWIHVKPCLERADFYWEPVPHLPYLVQLESGGGCAQPREGSRRVFLDECDESLAWRLSMVDDEGCALVHSALDDTMCLRAGIGPSMEDGTRMAVVPCDEEDVLQHFCYTGEKIHAAYDSSLCMVYRGNEANVGVDPIIMKTCNERQEPWNANELSPL